MKALCIKKAFIRSDLVTVGLPTVIMSEPTAMTLWPRTSCHLTWKWNVVATIITIIFISEFTEFFVVIFFWITAFIIIVTFILGYTRGFVDVGWTCCWRSITRSMWEYNLFLMIHAAWIMRYFPIFFYSNNFFHFLKSNYQHKLSGNKSGLKNVISLC